MPGAGRAVIRCCRVKRGREPAYGRAGTRIWESWNPHMGELEPAYKKAELHGNALTRISQPISACKFSKPANKISKAAYKKRKPVNKTSKPAYKRPLEEDFCC
ncbi:hypothetical protein LRR81_17390 [Metabacillus sp. GX 13764]|uniref:hypothetical protein n=1 Tax=Metabacillus kandeliae TaxID=2900151 RepID=UPI001E370D57|nr:hypothetical protein [Metabacillus kandeliae]MCD7036018.1 hypothetical protein [Metabacillus kandeliae]